MIYTVSSMESLIRSGLNEASTVVLTSVEILNSLNDGYKDVSLKAFCIENEDIVVTTSGNSFVDYSGYRVNYIEVLNLDDVIFVDTADTKFTDTTPVTWDVTETTFSDTHKGLIKILPSAVGHVKLNGTQPQFWFPWGKQIYIEPLPDDRYILKLYVSDYPHRTYPSVELSASTDIPSLLPKEFHSCIVDFALYFLSMKLNRWSQVAMYYNQYIGNLSRRKAEYVNKRPDGRYAHEIPNNVSMVRTDGR